MAPDRTKPYFESYLRSQIYLLIIQFFTQNPRFVYCFCTTREIFPLGSGPSSWYQLPEGVTVVVTIYTWHSARCRQSKVSNSGQYRRCKYPLWLRWGKSHKKSAKTRTWEIATKLRASSRRNSGLRPWEFKRPSRPTTSLLIRHWNFTWWIGRSGGSRTLLKPNGC
jgi:hypothetical protein